MQAAGTCEYRDVFRSIKSNSKRSTTFWHKTLIKSKFIPLASLLLDIFRAKVAWPRVLPFLIWFLDQARLTWATEGLEKPLQDVNKSDNFPNNQAEFDWYFHVWVDYDLSQAWNPPSVFKLRRHFEVRFSDHKAPWSGGMHCNHDFFVDHEAKSIDKHIAILSYLFFMVL